MSENPKKLLFIQKLKIWARKAHYPLFLLVLFLFVVDLAVADSLPWIDELILGGLAFLVSSIPEPRAQSSTCRRPKFGSQ